MSLTVTCPDCDRRIELAERPAAGKLFCPGCRTLIYLPEPGEDADAQDLTVAVASAPCPACKREVPAEAVLCVHCGYNYETGRRERTAVSVRPMRRSWLAGPVPIWFWTINLSRNPAGEVRLTVASRLLGIPLGFSEVDLKQCKQIHVRYETGFGALGWTIMAALLLLGVCPGLFWWWWASNQPSFILELPMRHGPPLLLYDGMSEARMRDILDGIRELAPLEIVRK